MGASRSETVQVKIYDREYTLKTTGESTRLKSLCSDLDQRMQEIAQATGAVDTLKVAVLAALSATDDFQRVRDQLRKVDESVSRRSLECVSILDAFLP